MAQNDMEIIVYKILSYLYECMKAANTLAWKISAARARCSEFLLSIGTR